MKLNPDCVRDILMATEDTVDSSRIFEYSKTGVNHERLGAYDHNEILYHINQCEMAGLITGVRRYDNGDLLTVSDLTPDGHEFLANIRQENLWNNTKEIAKKVGSSSLASLAQIAYQIVTEIIKSQFGLH